MRALDVVAAATAALVKSLGLSVGAVMVSNDTSTHGAPPSSSLYALSQDLVVDGLKIIWFSSSILEQILDFFKLSLCPNLPHSELRNNFAKAFNPGFLVHSSGLMGAIGNPSLKQERLNSSHSSWVLAPFEIDLILRNLQTYSLKRPWHEAVYPIALWISGISMTSPVEMA